MKKISEENEEFFWKTVKTLNWKKDYDSNRIIKDILEKSLIPKDKITIFKNCMDRFAEIAYDKIGYDEFDEDGNELYDKYINESDDGLEYLIDHIIGLGEETYYKCFPKEQEYNYHEVSKYARGENGVTTKDTAVEGFGYILLDMVED